MLDVCRRDRRRGRDGGRRLMLKLRRGTVAGGRSRLADRRGRWGAPPRLGGRDHGRAGRGRRRGGGQHRRARPRARIRRLRRRPREPDPRSRGRRTPSASRDEAELQLAPARGRSGRGCRGLEPPVPIGDPVLVLPLHGHLAPAAWAAAEAAEGMRSASSRRRGEACRDRCPSDVRTSATGACWPVTSRPRRLRRRARGDQPDRRAPCRRRGARLGRGDRRARARHPRLGDRYGHGGMAALDAAHAALAWGYRRCSHRGCRPATLVPGTSGSATTRDRYWICCWPASRYRFHSGLTPLAAAGR